MRPNIKEMFHRLNQEHFNNEIPNIPVVWNTRMTTTAGRCHFERTTFPWEAKEKRVARLKPTKIDLSVQLFSLNGYDIEKIERVLIHEMVHAFLIHKHNEKGHTRHFQGMMTKITGENINHRCHSYSTVGLKRKRARNIHWMCRRCGDTGDRSRKPLANRVYFHKCGGTVMFSKKVT